jgi:hypothetical protein
VEPGKKKPAKKGIISWANNPKKEKKTSKQANKQRQQNRREEKWYLISIIVIIIIIIPSAATVATTEVDEVGNLLLLCSMLSRMAVLQFPQRILLRTDGMIVLLASSALLL